jgi:hypothetical protein
MEMLSFNFILSYFFIFFLFFFGATTLEKQDGGLETNDI